jgi:hypothetical protein
MYGVGKTTTILPVCCIIIITMPRQNNSQITLEFGDLRK